MKRQLVQIIDKRNNSILTEMDDIIEYLQEILPHGSGIDSTWYIEYKPSTKKVYAHNSYHVMDEYGGYCGWYDFTVSYKLHDMNESHKVDSFEFINLNLHGEGKYLERISYGTRDYLEELLYNPEDAINWTIQQQQKSV